MCGGYAMPNRPDIVMWDTCVIIDAIQKDPRYWAAIEPFVKDAQQGKLLIVVSEISVVEVSHLSSLGEKGMSIEEQVKLISQWFENPYVVRRQQHPGISELAAEIGRNHPIKRASDRVIVATAVFNRIPVLHTRDGEGGKSGLIPLSGEIGNPPLRIEIPNYGSGTLFDEKLKTAEEGVTEP